MRFFTACKITWWHKISRFKNFIIITTSSLYNEISRLLFLRSCSDNNENNTTDGLVAWSKSRSLMIKWLFWLYFTKRTLKLPALSNRTKGPQTKAVKVCCGYMFCHLPLLSSGQCKRVEMDETVQKHCVIASTGAPLLLSLCFVKNIEFHLYW